MKYFVYLLEHWTKQQKHFLSVKRCVLSNENLQNLPKFWRIRNWKYFTPFICLDTESISLAFINIHNPDTILCASTFTCLRPFYVVTITFISQHSWSFLNLDVILYISLGVVIFTLTKTNIIMSLTIVFSLAIHLNAINRVIHSLPI